MYYPPIQGTSKSIPGNSVDIKSGNTPSIPLGDLIIILFTTPFTNTPIVTISFEGDVDYTSTKRSGTLSVHSISTAGFTIRYDGFNTPATASVNWMATDAGNI